MWAGLASWGLVGPFFEEDSPRGPVTVTVNSDRYYDMLRGPMEDDLSHQGGCNHQTWFQKDGAPPHRARRVLQLLKDRFSGRLISLGGDIPWPPRSPDLSPLDFYMWGYMKGKVYKNNPRDLNELKDNIMEEIASI